MITSEQNSKAQTRNRDSALMLASKIKAIIFDIDGIMTDGKITYTDTGEEIKSFNVKDGLGIKLLQGAGIQVAIITGRQSAIVSKRAAELNIELLIQGREDKLQASLELSEQLNLDNETIAYMGDDLPDLPAIIALGFGITVKDAVALVQNHADYICTASGGQGAVREACEFILEAQGRLESIHQDYTKGMLLS